MMISSVFTISNPENTAPAKKYGGKIVVCHTGNTDVAKSKDTIVCTESTSRVAKPANTNDTSSKRCQSFALPLHPKERIEYTRLVKGVIALSLNMAKSGKSPVHQNTNDKIGRASCRE